MAELLDEINSTLKAALKTGNQVAVSSLRLLLSEIHNAKIAKGGELTDEETIKISFKKAKQHKESIDAYEKGGRPDLVAKEKAELAVISKYLPKQLADSEIEKIVDEVIAQNGAVSAADFGKVIGQVMGRVSSQADGSRVSEIVKKKLGA